MPGARRAKASRRYARTVWRGAAFSEEKMRFGPDNN